MREAFKVTLQAQSLILCCSLPSALATLGMLPIHHSSLLYHPKLSFLFAIHSTASTGSCCPRAFLTT